jgi:hypothetical protein
MAVSKVWSRHNIYIYQGMKINPMEMRLQTQVELCSSKCNYKVEILEAIHEVNETSSLESVIPKS